MPELWFAPNIGTLDTLDLFRRPDEWAEARRYVTTFQFYMQHLLVGVDGEYDPPMERLVGPNRFDAFVKVDAFRKLTDWGISIAVEAGAIKPGNCDGTNNADAAKRFIERVERAGGRVAYISIDESLHASRSAEWEWLPAGLGCRMSLEDAGAAAARYALEVRKDCDVTIGITEPYPEMRADEILHFVAAMDRGGYHPLFVHLDVDRNDMKDRIKKKALTQAQVLADMTQLAQACDDVRIPFGQLLWGQMFRTPAEYRKSVWEWAQTVTKHPMVHRLIVQSFDADLTSIERKAERKELPHNLPSTDRLSHCALVKDVAQLFKVPARA